jgi:hypothetical protein
VTGDAVDLDDAATSATYQANLAAGRTNNRAAIDNVLTNGTPADTSDDFDAVLVPAGHAMIGYADRAGYPALTIPAGYGTGSAGRNPIGVTLVGTAFSEAKLLADGHALEQATDVRKAPSYTNPSMWRCVPGSTFFTGAFCNTGDRLLLNADPAQGVVQPQAPVAVAVTGTPVASAYGKSATLNVRVTGLPSGAAGTVTFTRGTVALGSAPVQGDGTASLTVAGRILPVGTSRVTATYRGDGGTAEGTVTVTVAKATAKVAGKVTSKKVVVKRTRAKLAVAVGGADKVPATGSVVVTSKGAPKKTARLKNGRVVLTLPKFTRTGRITITIRYSGNGQVSAAARTMKIRVVKK